MTEHEKYEAGLTALCDALREDYARWCNRADIRAEMRERKDFVVVEGRTYDKIVTTEYGVEKCVVGFVCTKDNPKKGFFKGDILKANSWTAPATNFARGTIFNLESIKKCAIWAGIS